MKMNKKRWIDYDHLFTPENIAKLEGLEAEHTPLYRQMPAKFKPRACRPGPCIWVIRDGKPVDFREED